LGRNSGYTSAVTTKESLHELIDGLTDDEAAELWDELTIGADAEAADGVLDGPRYPVLARIWDNDDDAIFDED
jgi:hypothetical protein